MDDLLTRLRASLSLFGRWDRALISRDTVDTMELERMERLLAEYVSRSLKLGVGGESKKA